MSEKIQQHVGQKFNTDLATDLDLNGIIKIYAIFEIAEDGSIQKIRARAPHPVLEEEIIRVIKALPVMIPGKIDDKPVPVMYSLPVVFKVQ